MPKGIKHTVQQGFLFARDLLAPLFDFQEVSILCYHSVSQSSHPTAVTLEQFSAHLEFLRKDGCVFVSLRDIEEWQKGRRTLPKRAVALTFDDGYADFESAVLPALRA